MCAGADAAAKKCTSEVSTSTMNDRTMASLYLVLAAGYPPKVRGVHGCTGLGDVAVSSHDAA